MIKLRINSSTITDLEDIKSYISKELDNTQAAIDTITKIIETYEKLKDFPFLGKSLSSVINIQTEYRYLLSGKYIIFYKTGNDLVSIYRILYAKMNYLEVLFGDIT